MIILLIVAFFEIVFFLFFYFWSSGLDKSLNLYEIAADKYEKEHPEIIPKKKFFFF